MLSGTMTKSSGGVSLPGAGAGTSLGRDLGSSLGGEPTSIGSWIADLGRTDTGIVWNKNIKFN